MDPADFAPALDALRVVVVPTDFSGRAGQALPLALAVAERTGAAIHLVHAPSVEGEEAVEQDVRARLDAIGMMYRYTLPARQPVAMHPVVLPAQPAGEAVSTYARQHGADLVVMASHGRRAPASGGWRSENVAHVVAETRCPVLLVPPGAAPRPEAVGTDPEASPLLGGWARALAAVWRLPQRTTPHRGDLWVVASLGEADAVVEHGLAGVLVVPPVAAGDGATTRVHVAACR